MTEFDDIFSNGLTTSVYLSVSVAFMFGYAAVALWLSRQPRRVALHWKYGRA